MENTKTTNQQVEKTRIVKPVFSREVEVKIRNILGTNNLTVEYLYIAYVIV